MTKTKTTHAEAAVMIRKELKQAFPSIKFSVTSKSYVGGSSIDISWNDGPTCNSVEKITSKYKYGHFDCMDDCYEITNSRKDIPQVQYIFHQRPISEGIMQEVFENLKETHRYFDEVKSVDESSEILLKEWGHWTARGFIYRLLSEVDLTNGYKPITL